MKVVMVVQVMIVQVTHNIYLEELEEVLFGLVVVELLQVLPILVEQVLMALVVEVVTQHLLHK